MIEYKRCVTCKHCFKRGTENPCFKCIVKLPDSYPSWEEGDTNCSNCRYLTRPTVCEGCCDGSSFMRKEKVNG